MTVTPASFRQHFPEFSNPVVYPDSGINFWIGLAGKLLRPDRWQDILDDGTELFTAHNLALERAAQSGSNGVPGMNSGVVSAKQIDKLSVSYDASMGLFKDAGHWNLTTFGTRFCWLMNMAGMGATQLGAGSAAGYGYGPGWPYYGVN